MSKNIRASECSKDEFKSSGISTAASVIGWTTKKCSIPLPKVDIEMGRGFDRLASRPKEAENQRQLVFSIAMASG